MYHYWWSATGASRIHSRRDAVYSGITSSRNHAIMRSHSLIATRCSTDSLEQPSQFDKHCLREWQASSFLVCLCTKHII